MKLATVEQIAEVTKHPNADKLDLVRVLNYWCIVGRDQYKVGDLIVFIQPDSVLPNDREWAQPLLRYTSRGRIRAVRLRGEWSMGLIVPLQVAIDETGNPIRFMKECVGDDLTNWLGITKHEPPVPGSGNAKRWLPFNIPRTDEERWQNLRNLDSLLGQEVVVTLKIDGQSFTAYVNGDESGICSRSLELKMGDGEPSTNWHAIERKYDMLNRMKDLSINGMAVRGEIYGPGIQSFGHNPHSQMPLGFGMYSVWNIGLGEYVSWAEVELFAKAINVPTVPVLERTVLTRELIDKYDHVLETIDGKPFEGVVVKGNGFSFKIINKHYDSKKE